MLLNDVKGINKRSALGLLSLRLKNRLAAHVLYYAQCKMLWMTQLPATLVLAQAFIQGRGLLEGFPVVKDVIMNPHFESDVPGRWDQIRLKTLFSVLY